MNVRELKIEEHKLHYHPERITKWMNGEIVYPLYVEITPYNGCNHRCSFCCYNYTGYKPFSLDTIVIENLMTELASLGTKSIMYAGEGEPLLHKNIAHLINHTKKCGLDVATQTNGVFATPEFFEDCVDSLSWIKFSIDAGNEKTHSKIHNCSTKDFSKIMYNLENAIRIRNEHGSKCRIGAQVLVMKENFYEIDNLYVRLKLMGIDYLSLKPFSKHPMMEGDINDISTFSMMKLSNKYRHNEDILVRNTSYSDIHQSKRYKKCLGLDFATYIDCKGDVYACASYLGDKDYVYGNIYKQTFKEIWDNKKYPNVDIKTCRKGCRLDKINQYLWNLAHPPEHVNFI